MIPTDVLATVPLFAELDRDQLARIAAVSHTQLLDAGACVLREAEPMPQSFLAVLAGGARGDRRGPRVARRRRRRLSRLW